MRMVIEDQPGKFSRRLNEQFPKDATYAQAFEEHDPAMPRPSKATGAICWVLAVLLLTYLWWGLMHGSAIPLVSR